MERGTKVWVWDFKKENGWHSYYLTHISGAILPHVIVTASTEQDFLAGKKFKTTTVKNAEPYKEGYCIENGTRVLVRDQGMHDWVKAYATGIFSNEGKIVCWTCGDEWLSNGKTYNWNEWKLP